MTDRDELLDHNYDGITEYDNDLPRWWVYLFWLTIIWSGGYTFYFHAAGNPTPLEELASDLKEIEQLQTKGGTTPAHAFTEGELLVLIKDSKAMSKGKEVYLARCAACHGALGEGLIGPNLTDNSWIHGGKGLEIRKTILEGVPEKGMLAWKTLLPPDDINAVTAYVWSLYGTNPPNGKAPEGQLVAR